MRRLIKKNMRTIFIMNNKHVAFLISTKMSSIYLYIDIYLTYHPTVCKAVKPRSGKRSIASYTYNY